MATRTETAGGGVSFKITIGQEAIERAILQGKHHGEPLNEKNSASATDQFDVADLGGHVPTAHRHRRSKYPMRTDQGPVLRQTPAREPAHR